MIPIVSTRKLMTPSTALNLTQVSASSAGRHEVGIRRAIEAAVGVDHAERGQHRKVPPEALAADRIEETIRHAVIVSSGSQPTRCWEGDGFELPVPREKSRYPIGAQLILL